ncbi:hypothetical protein ACFWVU_25195 [Streptomyces sp. NPDC058686]
MDDLVGARRARNQLPPGADQQPIPLHALEGRGLLGTRVLSSVTNGYR